MATETLKPGYNLTSVITSGSGTGPEDAGPSAGRARPENTEMCSVDSLLRAERSEQHWTAGAADPQRAVVPGDQMARVMLTVHCVGGPVPATELRCWEHRGPAVRGAWRHGRCQSALPPPGSVHVAAHALHLRTESLRPDCAQTPGETRLPLWLSLGAVWPWGSPSTSLSLRFQSVRRGEHRPP